MRIPRCCSCSIVHSGFYRPCSCRYLLINRLRRQDTILVVLSRVGRSDETSNRSEDVLFFSLSQAVVCINQMLEKLMQISSTKGFFGRSKRIHDDHRRLDLRKTTLAETGYNSEMLWTHAGRHPPALACEKSGSGTPASTCPLTPTRAGKSIA